MADKARADAAADAECRELRITLGKLNAAQCEEGDLQAKLLVVANKLARRAERAARQLGALKKLPSCAAAIKAVKASYKTAASPVFDKKSGSFFSPN
jgi:multidrug resistance efflux pump